MIDPKLILTLVVLAAVCPNKTEPKVLSSNYQCPEAQQELKTFRALMDSSRSPNLGVLVFNTLFYFNASEMYREPLYKAITKLCRQ